MVPIEARESVRWEYKVFTASEYTSDLAATSSVKRFSADLNREGNDGWEAVSMVVLPDERVAVLLKRPSSPSD